MEAIQKAKKRKVSETDIETLIECNRILKEHLDFLRAKLNKTEAVLDMYIKATEENEKSENLSLKIFLN